MSSLIKNLHIQNFKSVRDLSIECERINIFIGKPNAGKSNILEAISLLGVNYPKMDDRGKFLETTLRYRTLTHLFNNFNFRAPIEISANNNITAVLREGIPNADFVFQVSSATPIPLGIGKEKTGFFIPSITIMLKANGELQSAASTNDPIISSVKRYEFRGIVEDKKNGFQLEPPHGNNFYSIVEAYPDIRSEIQQFLKPNGLEFLIDVESQRMAVVQKTETSLLSFPLSLVPDTFQRYIFHLAAIMSNRSSVLLFEEPESHSYAPYVYQLAQHILDDEGGNQYFITTHNPYLLTPILQDGKKDVALFVTWFENYETLARRLSEEEVSDILNYGMDIFLNLDNFIPE